MLYVNHFSIKLGAKKQLYCVSTILPIQNTFLMERRNITWTQGFVSTLFLGDPVWLQKGINNPQLFSSHYQTLTLQASLRPT